MLVPPNRRSRGQGARDDKKDTRKPWRPLHHCLDLSEADHGWPQTPLLYQGQVHGPAIQGMQGLSTSLNQASGSALPFKIWNCSSTCRSLNALRARQPSSLAFR